MGINSSNYKEPGYNILESIKSKYIFQKIINNLPTKKYLYVVKYNNKLQKKLNININNYKEFSAKIEIEIIPEKNIDGKFINIKEEDKIFYHIYFDDYREEIKRNDLNKEDRIKKIKILIDFQVKSLHELFQLCKCVKSISFKKFFRNDIT